MGPIAARKIASAAVPSTFLYFGIAYFIGVVITAQGYSNPPGGWVPKTAVAKAAGTYDYTVKEAFGTWQAWFRWLMLFLNVSAGIMIISQASPIAQQQVHMTAVAAGTIVACSAFLTLPAVSSGPGFPTTSAALASIFCSI
jgi:OFA family oxalate/formate antiporter-like MFS transporter